VEFEHYRLDMR